MPLCVLAGIQTKLGGRRGGRASSYLSSKVPSRRSTSRCVDLLQDRLPKTAQLLTGVPLEKTGVQRRVAPAGQGGPGRVGRRDVRDPGARDRPQRTAPRLRPTARQDRDGHGEELPAGHVCSM